MHLLSTQLGALWSHYVFLTSASLSIRLHSLSVASQQEEDYHCPYSSSGSRSFASRCLTFPR